ncbi:DegT/DnrJ/EryC1/StrS family aminotransferase [Mycetocola zhadangensis]|uniref:DegT/DnrJ/EryC1/StrS family aminotransferase n=1 Tax=Mycetocola zhadangensis TaxID=1164595 RepID=A0A3L7J519_9MICO|nr:DegT/DnrJ/EryC1/StrS family aminotransferase [Mycetocola zhadangensis]RLQ84571.1 DegT/DnrJ/EryC1/StrS family aminotransferase [Mycetocola zhadangensis]GGE91768.1 glutamine--scyllo-inositol aminotransferase [Mycetocola zhadangensis]
MMQVPLVDLSRQQSQIADQIREGFNRVIAESSFILGPQVEEFEELWANYCGVTQAVGVGNGTDAIELALRAAGIGPGDDVLIPANTFVATAGAVMRTGASLVLADCDDNYLISVDDVQRQITPNTRAVIGVHLYGQAAPIELLRAGIGTDIVLVEDAAQSQGARRYGKRAGSLGTVGATSFYPGKNLGAYGDAGAVMTDSEEIGNAVRRLRNHGGTAKYEHPEVGFNSRMDSLQAVVLSAKLALLDEWNAQRARAAERYTELLSDVEEIVLPQVAEGNEHVYHLYVVRVPRRDDVVAQLNASGIGAGIHYPRPVHIHRAYAGLGYSNGDFPRAEQFAREIISLPLYPGISMDEVQYVADTLRRAVSSR